MGIDSKNALMRLGIVDAKQLQELQITKISDLTKFDIITKEEYEKFGLVYKGGSDSDILIDTYKNMRNNPNITGQAHHLNQDAAFRDVIPKNDGVCVELDGNVFTDAGSPHNMAHASMESFWNNYRKGGNFYREFPTISEYNTALKESLRAGGLTDIQADKAVQSAIDQQLNFGLSGETFVPRIPGRINFAK